MGKSSLYKGKPISDWMTLKINLNVACFHVAFPSRNVVISYDKFKGSFCFIWLTTLYCLCWSPFRLRSQKLLNSGFTLQASHMTQQKYNILLMSMYLQPVDELRRETLKCTCSLAFIFLQNPVKWYRRKCLLA